MEAVYSVDNWKKRGVPRELPQAKNKNMRSVAPSPPSTLSFQSPPSPPKRRRLVHKKKLIGLGFVRSTGLDNDEVDDQSLSTPANASTNLSRAAVVAEEMDEYDMLATLDRDEVAFGDAIGDDRDEDFIPGPDDNEGSGEGYEGEADADPSSSDDDIATSSGGAEDIISPHLLAEITAKGGTNAPAAPHMAPARQMSEDRCKARFQRCLRMLIEGLKKFAKGIKYDPTEQGSTYPISYSFWFLLCRVSADDLMESYMAAIPHKVQVLLGQSSFAPESILALGKDWKHHHLSKGVYVNLLFDKLIKVNYSN